MRSRNMCNVYSNILMRVDGTIFIRDKKFLIIKIKSTICVLNCIVLYWLIMTIIAPQWFLGQLMSMFIFLLILILGFLKFLSSNCWKQCQLYWPNIARSENQFWNANKPSLALPLSCLLYECKISSWHLFRLLTTCYRLTLKLTLHGYSYSQQNLFQNLGAEF